jgi:hypothetical protein
MHNPALERPGERSDVASVFAGVAQLAGLLLPLATCAGGSDEEPVGDGDRTE